MSVKQGSTVLTLLISQYKCMKIASNNESFMMCIFDKSWFAWLQKTTYISLWTRCYWLLSGWVPNTKVKKKRILNKLLSHFTNIVLTDTQDSPIYINAV